MVEPVLKWAGGKRTLLEEIYARFPAAYERYHEPFFGGGAVFFDLEPDEGTINDTNPRLVNFYDVVRDHPEELIGRLRAFEPPETDTDASQAFADENWKGKEIEQYFYQQRARFNRRANAEEQWPASTEDRIEEAALLGYLNRTCYNGLYRENSDGGFNVPIGRYTNPEWVQAERIRAANRVLMDTDIRNEEFEYVLDVAGPGDLVYFDPPYQPMSATANFAEYTAAGFGRDDQERLLEVVSALDARGTSVILSNSAVLYDSYADAGFHVELVGAPRSINSDGSARGEVEEIIATNVPDDSRSADGQPSITTV